MLYEMHCRGHMRRYRSAGGYSTSSLGFCGGCRMRPIRKLLKNSCSDAVDLCGEAFVCPDVAVLDPAYQNI